MNSFPFKIGQGYDLHRLDQSRKLILGGVEIPYDKGLLGHSDADVLVHAIMDALLGALALGDIGKHFPDNDENYKDIDSIILLKKVYSLISEKGYKIGNIDSIIIAQAPKLSSYIPIMQRNIAEALKIEENCVSIKATTKENMDSIGRGEAIAALACTILYK